MDMILKTTDLCKNFKGQMAVNNSKVRKDISQTTSPTYGSYKRNF